MASALSTTLARPSVAPVTGARQSAFMAGTSARVAFAAPRPAVAAARRQAVAVEARGAKTSAAGQQVTVDVDKPLGLVGAAGRCLRGRCFWLAARGYLALRLTPSTSKECAAFVLLDAATQPAPAAAAPAPAPLQVLEQGKSKLGGLKVKSSSGNAAKAGISSGAPPPHSFPFFLCCPFLLSFFCSEALLFIYCLVCPALE